MSVLLSSTVSVDVNRLTAKGVVACESLVNVFVECD